MTNPTSDQIGVSGAVDGERAGNEVKIDGDEPTIALPYFPPQPRPTDPAYRAAIEAAQAGSNIIQR